jgi:hypothetical protein
MTFSKPRTDLPSAVWVRSKVAASIYPSAMRYIAMADLTFIPDTVSMITITIYRKTYLGSYEEKESFQHHPPEAHSLLTIQLLGCTYKSVW